MKGPQSSLFDLCLSRFETLNLFHPSSLIPHPLINGGRRATHSNSPLDHYHLPERSRFNPCAAADRSRASHRRAGGEALGADGRHARRRKARDRRLPARRQRPVARSLDPHALREADASGGERQVDGARICARGAGLSRDRQKRRRVSPVYDRSHGRL